jgi:GTPase
MQDIRVLKQAEDLRKGIIIGVNKWDLIDKETNTARDYERSIYERLQTMDYVPVVFISALTRQRVPKLIDLAIEVDAERKEAHCYKQTERLPGRSAGAVAPSDVSESLRAHQVRHADPRCTTRCSPSSAISRRGYERAIDDTSRTGFARAFGFRGVPMNLVFKQK